MLISLLPNAGLIIHLPGGREPGFMRGFNQDIIRAWGERGSGWPPGSRAGAWAETSSWKGGRKVLPGRGQNRGLSQEVPLSRNRGETQRTRQACLEPGQGMEASQDPLGSAEFISQDGDCLRQSLDQKRLSPCGSALAPSPGTG